MKNKLMTAILALTMTHCASTPEYTYEQKMDWMDRRAKYLEAQNKVRRLESEPTKQLTQSDMFMINSMMQFGKSMEYQPHQSQSTNMVVPTVRTNPYSDNTRQQAAQANSSLLILPNF
jgi:hypothetical protein